MKRLYLVLVAVAFAAVIVISSCRGKEAPVPTAPASVTVAATIYPLYDIARNIIGSEGTVKVIVPPGASPHLFEFSPKQIRDLQEVRAVFAIGHGLDNWAAQIANVVKGSRVIIVDQGIGLRRFRDGTIDPHYWLHFGNARKIADNIGGSLAAIDPAHAETYLENAEKYKQKLAAEERMLNEVLKPARGIPILTFHDAWFYFAEDFGLTIQGTFEPAAGEEPTPRYLAELQKKITTGHIDVIFVEPQLSTGLLKAFAQDNKVRIAELDPLGGVEGRMTYAALMDFNANAVRRALHAGGP
ncbi:MAG: metal ABC transporter substrate-binding protein [Actinomycetota bacterium]